MKQTIYSLLLLCLSFTAEAQTYKYRCVKTVTSYGEERAGDGKIIYLTFTGGRSQVFFSDMNGNRENGSGGYCNNVVPGGASTGFASQYINPRTYSFKGEQNGVKVYAAQRPIINNLSKQISGYTTDFANFSSDYRRINFKAGSSQGYDGYHSSLTPEYMSEELIYVYELVVDANQQGFY